MASVETVRGPVDVTSSGRTLMHEHVFVLDPEALAELRARLGCALLGRGRARRGRDREAPAPSRRPGIRTLVDPTVVGLGRCIPRIQRINAEVDLNIVVATGLYAFMELPQFFRYRSVDQLAELFVRDIREGIDDTGVRSRVPEMRGRGVRARRRRADDRGRDRRRRLETGRPDHGAHERGRTHRPPRRSRRSRRRVSSRPGSSSRTSATRTTSTTSGRSPPAERSSDATASASSTSTRSRIGSGRWSHCSRRATQSQIVLSHDAACFFDFFTGDEKFAGETPDYLLVAHEVSRR